MRSSLSKIEPVSGRPFYMWQVSGKLIFVQLSFDVIDRMHPQVMRGFAMLKSRGAEIGGILLGKSEPGLPRKVSIEDFDAVRSEYQTGPSYNLSENDLVAFEAAIAHRNSGAKSTGLSPVGFYRSHTRDELYMDDADLALAHRYFPSPCNVFLLIKPLPTRTSVAGFFFWEEGKIHHESSYLQFPFDSRALGERATPPAPQCQPEPERPLPPYTAPSSHLPVWQWLLVPVLLAVVGVAGIFVHRDVGTSKASFGQTSAKTELPLNLSVAIKENQLDVTWEPNAPAILQAERGVLSISGSGNNRDLELSRAQLRTGRVLDSRLSGDVALQLQVFAKQRDPVSESVRIVSSDPAHPLPEAVRSLPVPSPPLAATAVAPMEKKPKKTARRSAPRVSAHPAPTKRTAKSAHKPPVQMPVVPPQEESEVEPQRPAPRK
jgi:hypothetical protein